MQAPRKTSISFVHASDAVEPPAVRGLPRGLSSARVTLVRPVVLEVLEPASETSRAVTTPTLSDDSARAVRRHSALLVPNADGTATVQVVTNPAQQKAFYADNPYFSGAMR